MTVSIAPRFEFRRRDFLASSLTAMTCGSLLSGQELPTAITKEGKPALLNRFPRVLQNALGAKVRAAEAVGIARREQLKTRADAEAYVQKIRQKIQSCFGPFPERTPLNARVAGIIDRPDYHIEKVIFESRPQFFVTANLYVPKNGSSKSPGVIAECGHSENGKAAEAYQSFVQSLARLGYVVLIFDPIGQGERLQYADESLKSKVGVGVHEHLKCGNQQFLVGEFFGTWRAWDAIRALDYLLTRPEVDPRHVGITGNSGGGTMTTWLCGIEPRWTMAAPSCFVTTFRRNFENELPADTEQCPPNVLQLGLDHCDFLAAMAPKPVMIIAAEKDYFDVRGAIEAYERLVPIYRLLDAEQNLQLFIGPNTHGYSKPNREAMYRFFHQQVGKSSEVVEPLLTVETDETLRCTVTGQVAELSSRTVMSFTAERAKSLALQRGQLGADEVVRRVRSMIPVIPHRISDYQILRPVPRKGYPSSHFTCYALETEPDVRVIVTRLSDQAHLSRPPVGERKVLLYVAHHSSDVELRESSSLRRLIADQPDVEVFAIDVRGIGESRPDTCGENQFLTPYGNDYFYAAHSIMLAQPLPLQRAFDLLRVIQWLKSLGRHELHLAADGWGTIPAMLAAVISPELQRITLENAPASYQRIAEEEHYDWPLSSFIPAVLEQFDLPDCYRVLESRTLKLTTRESIP